MNKLSIIEYSRPIIKVIKKADLKENDSQTKRCLNKATAMERSKRGNIYSKLCQYEFSIPKNTTNKNVSVS